MQWTTNSKIAIAKWWPYGNKAMRLDQLLAHYKRRWQKSLFALVVPPLIFGLGACGKFADLVVAPPPTVKLNYLNPPRPNPVIPPTVEFGPLPYWEAKKVPTGKLICLQSDHYVSLRVFNKEISFWMKQANAGLDYHERMNKPPKDNDSMIVKEKAP